MNKQKTLEWYIDELHKSQRKVAQLEAENEALRKYKDVKDLGDDDERLEWLNDYFGEQYTSWSQISWSQMKWFLMTLRLNKDIEQEALLRVARAAKELTKVDERDGALKHVVRYGDHDRIDWHIVDSLLIQLKEWEHYRDPPRRHTGE